MYKFQCASTYLVISVLVQMYKKGKATLTKGAEVAGVTPDTFRGILNDQGIVTPDTVEWESIE